MHKTAQADLDMRPTACLHSLDVSNAHNELERGAAAKAIQELVPEMSAWAVPELASVYVGVYVGPSGERLKITRDRGGDQGDPMVGLIYLIVYHSVIARTEQIALPPTQPRGPMHTRTTWTSSPCRQHANASALASARNARRWAYGATWARRR